MQKVEVSEILNELVSSIQYEAYLYECDNEKNAKKRFENVLTFIGWLDKKASADNKNLTDMVQMITLINLLSNQKPEEINAVHLSTLHASKGLEYPYVYLIGCEEGTIPHHEAMNHENRLEEERRLMYVGVTRAQYELTISYANEKKQGGELRKIERSRFIEEMGDNNIIDNSQLKNIKLNDAELKDGLTALQNLLKVSG